MFSSRIALVAIVALVCCAALSAASINPDFPVASGGGFTYPINLQFDPPENLQPGDVFAIFDVGNVFNITLPVDWSVTTPLTNTVTGALVTDLPNVKNIL